MLNRRQLVALGALVATVIASPALAQSKLKVVASFSILGDLVRNVGGERIELAVLVGPNSDAHVYAPTPADAKTVGEAKVVFVNGLGLEGWMTRLVKAAGAKAPAIVVSQGIKSLRMEDEHNAGRMTTDPHAWQSVGNARIYVGNIRAGLIAADPAGKNVYEANAKAYLARLDALEREVLAAIAKIPADRRRIITTHDAFGYFAAAYGVEFIAPAGVSTEAEPSAKAVATIIDQIKRQKIPAVFLENVSDPRLIQQIARETGAKVGGTLYSDALSVPQGPAASYIEMMRNNIRELGQALGG
jgi:zinc/manganese transport system substrate-binding protein